MADDAVGSQQETAKTKTAKPKARKTWIERLKTSTYVVVLAAAAAFIVTTADVTDAIDKILVWTGVQKPDALRLAEDDRRGQFSREVTRTAWRRLFWMRRVLMAQQYNFPQDEKNKTWDTYIEVLDKWNSELMSNIIGVGQYYPDKVKLFENDIQSDFRKIHYCLEAFRHPGSGIACEISSQLDLAQIEKAIDSLNYKLFVFVCGHRSKGDNCMAVN
jgi:hypothetical protein